MNKKKTTKVSFIYGGEANILFFFSQRFGLYTIYSIYMQWMNVLKERLDEHINWMWHI